MKMQTLSIRWLTMFAAVVVSSMAVLSLSSVSVAGAWSHVPERTQPEVQSVVTSTVYLPVIVGSRGTALPTIGPVSVNAETIPLYGKFEANFLVATTADNVYVPYEATPLLGESGISVDMLLTAPNGAARHAPCFYYQPTDGLLRPIGQPDWRCRFAPDTIGTWRYVIHAVDENGETVTPLHTFVATTSTKRGFVRVSTADPRYFEFSDGTPFVAPLIGVEDGNPLNGLDQIRAIIPTWGQSGVRFVRWFPTGESANYYVVPFGDNIRMNWGFGTAGTVFDGDPAFHTLMSFKPYYYSGQTIHSVPNDGYRLSFRAKVTGNKVLRPELGQALIEIRASDWQTYTLETIADGETLTLWLHDGYHEDDNTPGTIRVDNVTVQRDETGQGGWGPNLLTRSDSNTFKYVDQVAAARLDEIMRLSELYGVYHKLTLFHKNDEVLGQLAADGSIAPDWDIDNFYSAPGQVVNRYERAYARYFVARWGYSTALHSLEFGNENMLTASSFAAAYDVLGYIRSIEPRHILLSNSFWGYFVTDFWNDLAHGSLMDYADKHWYARVGSDDPELVSTVTNDSAANVRECQHGFDAYQAQLTPHRPIVRGETGVWDSTGYGQLNLGSGAATYYHKQLWAQLGDQCAGEWYTAYLIDHNLWAMFSYYEQFLQGEPINNGHYIDIGTDLSGITLSGVTGNVRAWGKLDATDGRAIVWIDNASDTWRRVADGLSVAPASATLSIGSVPNGVYDVTVFNTSTGTSTVSTQSVTTGRVVVSVANLQHDVAIKFKRR